MKTIRLKCAYTRVIDILYALLALLYLIEKQQQITREKAMLLFRKDKLSIVVRCNRQNSVIELQHMTPYMNEYHTNIHS